MRKAYLEDHVKGYARVSTLDQNLARQLKALEEAGCERIYQEKVSGKNTNRPELQKLLSELKPGDVVIITELARFSRSTRDLFELIDTFKEKGAALKSLKESWLDLSQDNPYSNLLLTIMAGLAQFEREMIRVRQAEGVAIAKEQGKYKGRIKKYTEKNPALKHALELYKERDKTVKEICEITKISRATLYREIARIEVGH